MQRAAWRPTVDKDSVAVIAVVQGEQMAAVCDICLWSHPAPQLYHSSASRLSAHTHTRAGQGVVILLQAVVTCHNRTYQWLTCSNPPWKAGSSISVQEIPFVLCNANVHCRVHKVPLWTGVIHCTPSHLILFSHLHQGLSGGQFPSRYGAKTKYAFLSE